MNNSCVFMKFNRAIENEKERRRKLIMMLENCHKLK